MLDVRPYEKFLADLTSHRPEASLVSNLFSGYLSQKPRESSLPLRDFVALCDIFFGCDHALSAFIPQKSKKINPCERG
jgi:hypothetical protein